MSLDKVPSPRCPAISRGDPGFHGKPLGQPADYQVGTIEDGWYRDHGRMLMSTGR